MVLLEVYTSSTWGNTIVKPILVDIYICQAVSQGIYADIFTKNLEWHETALHKSTYSKCSCQQMKKLIVLTLKLNIPFLILLLISAFSSVLYCQKTVQRNCRWELHGREPAFLYVSLVQSSLGPHILSGIIPEETRTVCENPSIMQSNIWVLVSQRWQQQRKGIY